MRYSSFFLLGAGSTSKGSEEEVGAGASVKSVSAPAQTLSAFKAATPTTGRDEEENPSSPDLVVGRASYGASTAAAGPGESPFR